MELQTKTRSILGKKVKSLRAQGEIPAEVFGKDFSNLHISVSEKEFVKTYKEAGENTIVNLINDKNKIPTFISAVSYNPITRKINSIDFRKLKMDEKIQTKVPVKLIGEAPAIKNGYMLINVLNEIEVEALPNEIPHRFEIDLSKLENPGDSVQTATLNKFKNVKILTPLDMVIITVVEKAKEKEESVATETVPTTTAATPATETTNAKEKPTKKP